VLEVGPDLKSVDFRPDHHLAAFAVHFAELSGADVAGYYDHMAEFFEAQKHRLEEQRTRNGDESIHVGMDFIRAMAAHAVELLGSPPPVGGIFEAVVVSRNLVDRSGRRRNLELPPVNGFFYDDLSTAIEAAAVGGPSGLVPEYLSDRRGEGHHDCLDPNEIQRALDLIRLPNGRWPSEFALTLMQQVAVNESLRRLSRHGIFSINGPPGTGKTTLLADIVAAVVVERARLMTEFRAPEDAFKRHQRSMAEGEGFILDPRFRDFTIVVASSNNGAVENVTRELPDAARIAQSRLADCARFKETAAALLNRRSLDPDEAAAEPVEVREAWGLIAAALGNKSNPGAFCAALRAKEPVAPGEGDGSRPRRDAPSNIFRQLHELGRPDWSAAKSGFQAAIAEAHRLKDEIAEHERLCGDVVRLRSRSGVLEERRISARDAANAARHATRETQDDLAVAREALDAADRDVGLSKPSLVRRVIAALGLSKAARASCALYTEMVRRRADASASLQTAVARVREASRQLQEADAAVNTAVAEEVSQRRAYDDARTMVARIARDHGGITDIVSTLALPREQMHQLLPRRSEALDAARTEVFVKALAVHQAFIGGSVRQFPAQPKLGN
jgi:flagellar biosynthesis GTPase FlhF